MSDIINSQEFLNAMGKGANGTNTRFHYEDGSLIVQNFQPLKQIKAIERSVQRDKYHRPRSRRKGYEITARIPVVIEEQWRRHWKKYAWKDYSWHQYKAMKLNSSEGNMWRIAKEMPIHSWQR